MLFWEKVCRLVRFLLKYHMTLAGNTKLSSLVNFGQILNAMQNIPSLRI